MARDFTISSIVETQPQVTPDGLILGAEVRVAEIDGYRLTGMAVVATVSEPCQVRIPEDFERARLTLMRAARDRLRDLATQALRDAD